MMRLTILCWWTFRRRFLPTDHLQQEYWERLLFTFLQICTEICFNFCVSGDQSVHLSGISLYQIAMWIRRCCLFVFIILEGYFLGMYSNIMIIQINSIYDSILKRFNNPILQPQQLQMSQTGKVKVMEDCLFGPGSNFCSHGAHDLVLCLFGKPV
jgi:hypothetical protein